MANPESEQDHDTVPPILTLESNLATSSGSDNASQDEEDDGQALLPRHTKVTVTGNNRTKQSLVGLTGVVKKAVGLGGWHWLVLSNGVECRLQRNALAVLEAPTGNETDFSDLDEDTTTGYQAEMLPRVRPRRPPRPISFSPDGPQQQRKSARVLHPGGSRVDFNKLDTLALKRYRRIHKLDDVGPNPTKEELVLAVDKHFNAQVVDENRAIAMFVHAAARRAAVAH